MTLKFLDKRTGRVTEVLEPHEVEQEANTEADRLDALGHSEARRQAHSIRMKGRRRAQSRARLLDLMHKQFMLWERVADNTPVTGPPSKAKVAKKAAAPRAPKPAPEPDDD